MSSVQRPRSQSPGSDSTIVRKRRAGDASADAFTLPEWASFKVFAYKVPVQNLRDIGYKRISPSPTIFEGEEPETPEEFAERARLEAICWLDEKARIATRTYGQGMLEDYDDVILLSFCTSVPVQNDPHFDINSVCPSDERVAKRIKKYARLLGMEGEEPKWYIPDEALDFPSIMLRTVEKLEAEGFYNDEESD